MGFFEKLFTKPAAAAETPVAVAPAEAMPVAAMPAAEMELATPAEAPVA